MSFIWKYKRQLFALVSCQWLLYVRHLNRHIGFHFCHSSSKDGPFNLIWEGDEGGGGVRRGGQEGRDVGGGGAGQSSVKTFFAFSNTFYFKTCRRANYPFFAWFDCAIFLQLPPPTLQSLPPPSPPVEIKWSILKIKKPPRPVEIKWSIHYTQAGGGRIPTCFSYDFFITG